MVSPFPAKQLLRLIIVIIYAGRQTDGTALPGNEFNICLAGGSTWVSWVSMESQLDSYDDLLNFISFIEAFAWNHGLLF